MELLPGWYQRLQRAPTMNETALSWLEVPKSPAFYASQITKVTTATQAQAMVALAFQRAIAYIGIDTEFRYDRPASRLAATRPLKTLQASTHCCCHWHWQKSHQRQTRV